MSIDARINNVIRSADGSGSLILEDRPPTRPGENPGCAGQNSLEFSESPANVRQLVGKNIWGGSDSIMLGDVKIAGRKGYGGIIFATQEVVSHAIEKYNNRNKK